MLTTLEAALNLSHAELQRIGTATRERALAQHAGPKRARELTPVLTDRFPGDEEFFAPDEEILVLDTSGDVLAHAAHLGWTEIEARFTDIPEKVARSGAAMVAQARCMRIDLPVATR